MRQIIQIILAVWMVMAALSMWGQDSPVPDAPSALWHRGQVWKIDYRVTNSAGQVEPVRVRAKFLAARQWSDPPLRSNREILTSKSFVVPHLTYAITAVIDIRTTHGAREHYSDSLIPWAGVTTMDFLFDKYVFRPVSFLGPFVGIQHHIRDAREGSR